MSDQVAFEDGPCFTETCELCDPEFVFIPENPTVDVTEIENLEDYAINSEMVPLTDLEFYVNASEVPESEFSVVEEAICV